MQDDAIFFGLSAVKNVGEAPAQVDGLQIGVCQGVGGMFAAAGTIVFTNQDP